MDDRKEHQIGIKVVIEIEYKVNPLSKEEKEEKGKKGKQQGSINITYCC